MLKKKFEHMKKILNWIRQILLLIRYFLAMDEYKFNKFPYHNICRGKKAMVMGNGPSLKKLLNEYEKGNASISHDSFFVNMAPLNDTFYKIKPKHLFLSDFVFARDTENRTANVKRMYSRLQNEVDWPLVIYLTFTKRKYCRQLISYSKITNPNIKFVFMNRKYCNDLVPCLRNWLYSKGWFMPVEGTVLNTALYVAILEGYDEVELYGAETSMFLDIRVNDNNQVGIIEKHFYDGEKFLPLMTDDGNPSRVHDFLYCVYHMLNSYHLLSQFATYKKVKVYNCTPKSMIDSFERKKMSIYEGE